MLKKIICPVLFLSVTFLVSCSNDDTKHAAIPVDSTTAAGKADSTKRVDSSAAKIAPANANNSSADSAKKIIAKATGITEKVKEKSKKKIVAATDSIAAMKKSNAAPAQGANAATATNTATSGNANADKPFSPKYGIIPRNTTETNITSFLNAFPDKTTFIKVYYDADPDSEMQAVRTQIIKVLKKSGYISIADLPITFHPMHMPKDIHYELQHDGSVVIWIPVADTGQN